MNFEKLCTYDEMDKMSMKDRNSYLDELYNGNKTHKIFARIEKITNKQLEISGIYYLMDDNKAYDFRLYKDNDKTNLYAKCSKKDKARFAEIIKELKCGEYIVCHIEANSDYDEINKFHYITFEPSTISKDVSFLDEMLEKNGLSLDLSNVYISPDNNSLLVGEIEKKCQATLSAFDYEKKLIVTEIEKLKKDEKTLDEGIKNKAKEQEEKLQLDYDKQIKEYKRKIFLKKLEIHKELVKKKKELSFLSKYIDILNCSNKAKENKNDLCTYKDFSTFDDMIKCAQKILKIKYGLGYRIEILESMYVGIQTDQLLLLVGRPGTGKSSLIENFPKVFNFENTAIIPVQPNWTDKSDLLGYYNPIEKNYISTPFLDNLLNFVENAKDDMDKLYFICLDEMNLSHVEYYFAEFLSKLQSDRTIQLYSKELFDDIISELKINGIKDNDSYFNGVDEYTNTEEFKKLSFEEKKYFFELRKMAKMIVKYPYEIEIPRNIKFIGTLNQDETTMNISPKVLDRSYVIRLENQNADKIVFDDTDIDYCIKYKSLAEYDNIFDTNDVDYSSNEIVEKIQSITHYSQRCINILLSNLEVNNWCRIIGRDRYIDLLISCTVLPKIRIQDKEYAQKIKLIKSLVKKYPLSNYILNLIDNESDKEIDYWSY